VGPSSGVDGVGKESTVAQDLARPHRREGSSTAGWRHSAVTSGADAFRIEARHEAAGSRERTLNARARAGEGGTGENSHRRQPAGAKTARTSERSWREHSTHTVLARRARDSEAHPNATRGVPRRWRHLRVDPRELFFEVENHAGMTISWRSRGQITGPNKCSGRPDAAEE
jgi:hypothetical protein